MPTLGQVHLASAVLALLAGAWVLLGRKGTTAHRRGGWAYVSAMLVLNGTALAIYRLTGGFGPFHVAALVSLGTLVAGVVPAVRRPRPPNWLEHHYFFLAYSYLGLTAAAVAETATRVPALRAFTGGPTPVFWAAVLVATLLVMGGGGRIVRRRAEPTMRPFRRGPGTSGAGPGKGVHAA